MTMGSAGGGGAGGTNAIAEGTDASVGAVVGMALGSVWSGAVLIWKGAGSVAA